MTLYRKYRPRRFADLIGQETASTTLQQALLKDRAAHAYLFSGPRGTGKTSTARIFAKALVCEDPQRLDGQYEPCDACPSCQMLSGGQTPDIVEIDAASNRGIEDIRALREAVQYGPLQLNRKIYIIDEVHMLTTEAFNALLKTVEEPPPYCLFILATTELHKVPSTVRSRCQLVRFERGSVDAISKSLAHVVSQEKISAEPEALRLVAELADGGFRDALTLLESLSTQHDSITVEVSRRGLGLISQQQVAALLSAALSGNLAATLELVGSHSSALSGSPERLIGQLINELRRRLHEQEGEPAALIQALDCLLEAHILQRSSPIPSLPLEIACLTICQHNGRQGKEPLERPALQDVTPPAVPGPPAVRVAPIPVPRASVPVIELSQEPVSDSRRAWKMMVEQVCRENPILGQTLKQTVFHTSENAVITIYVRYKFHADKVNETKNQARIKAILRDLTNRDWSVTYQVNSSLPRHAPAKAITTGLADATSVFGHSPK